MFIKREPIQYWDLKGLVDEDLSTQFLENAKHHMKRHPRNSVEQPRYPFRVINTQTLQFERDNILYQKSYAVLSHTWTQVGSEVTFQTAHAALEQARKDSANPRFTPPNDSTDPGVLKLRKAIQAAKDLNYPYIWIDNCCIDKTDTLELIESIASMGDWYQNARVCIIYLDDFNEDNLITNDKLTRGADKTRWATRGWTLQEVVMCPDAVFYNKKWKVVADTRKPNAPRLELSKVCRVPAKMLCCGGTPNAAAALVLQIAARRKTFKPEDRAYSLMGILGVRMRADYGEGQTKAISRLFDRVLHTTGDVSIFNWAGIHSRCTGPGRSMYPADFQAFKHIDLIAKPAIALSPVTLNHIGVHARFDICKMKEITVEDDNFRTLKTLRLLDKSLRDSGKPTNVECSCTCDFAFFNDELIITTVLCSLQSLIAVLEGLENHNTRSGLQWVMARFSGIRDADWFLCEIKHDTPSFIDGVFTDTMNSMAGTHLGMPGTSNAGNSMQYLKDSEFLGRRVATDDLDQAAMPQTKEFIEHAYLWIG
ncbi:heterokaryon incompatibility protein-domain-containing protein [Trichophaea hybrida]|nr:heterokaryon incompatibility protein-domain-containing protein [Trichophaea hybrida]